MNPVPIAKSLLIHEIIRNNSEETTVHEEQEPKTDIPIAIKVDLWSNLTHQKSREPGGVLLIVIDSKCLPPSPDFPPLLCIGITAWNSNDQYYCHLIEMVRAGDR